MIRKMAIRDGCLSFAVGRMRKSRLHVHTAASPNLVPTKAIAIQGGLDERLFSKIDREAYSSIPRAHLREGDVLVALRANAKCPHAGLVGSEILPAAAAAAIAILRCDESIVLPRFLVHLIQSPEFGVEWTKRRVKVGLLPLNNLVAMAVNMPSLSVQHSICASLAESDQRSLAAMALATRELSRIDEAFGELISRGPAMPFRAGRSLLEDVGAWRWTDFIDLVSYRREPASKANAHHINITRKDFDKPVPLIVDGAWSTRATLATKIQVRPGDVILGRVPSGSVKVAMAMRPAVAIRDYLVLGPLQHRMRAFVFCLLRSPSFQDFFVRRPPLWGKWKMLESCKIAMPPHHDLEQFCLKGARMLDHCAVLMTEKG